MSMIKPNKPGCYEGKRDLLAVSSWLYQVKQYLDLVQVGSSGTILDDGTRISFASTSGQLVVHSGSESKDPNHLARV